MKKTGIIAAAALLGIAAIALGYYVGQRNAREEAHMQTTYLDVLNAVAAYSFESDVASAIQSKNDAKALCLVNLRASAFVNKVRACLSDSACKRMMEPELVKMAPELLGQGQLKIKYYAEGQTCP